MPGFGVRCTKTGVMAFVVWVRGAGKKRLITLARCTSMSIADARKAALVEIDKTASGAPDLVEQRREERAAMTVNDGFDWYVTSHMPDKVKRGRMAERTVVEYQRQVDSYVRPPLGKMKIEDVDRADVMRCLAGIGGNGTQANRVNAMLKAAFNLFAREGWRPDGTNPCRLIEHHKENARTRRMLPSERASFLRGFGRHGRRLHRRCTPVPVSIRMALVRGPHPSMVFH